MTAAPTLSAFPDWLPPMLVKELRLGMRKSMFISIFLSIQCIMLILIGCQLLSKNTIFDQSFNSFFDGLLWGGLGFVMNLLMPLRGLNAVDEEKKTNTLELVQVTHLSSTRIIAGKWVAIVTQSLLILISVLPYAALRYFFGSIDVIASLSNIGSLILSSMTLTSVCLWLSTMPRATRGLAVGLGIVLFQVIGGMMMIRSAGGPSFWLSAFVVTGWNAWVGLFGAVISTLFMIELAASRIAFPAENHARALRLIAFTAAVVALIFAWFKQGAWLAAALPVMLASALHALTDVLNDVPSIYSPWAHKRMPHRLLAYWLTPGWASGMLHVFILCSLLLATLTAIQTHTPRAELDRLAITIVLLYCAFISPLLVLSIRSITKARAAIYLLFHLLCASLLIISKLVNSVTHLKGKSLNLETLTPTSAYLWIATNDQTIDDEHWVQLVTISLPIGGIILIYVAFRAASEFRRMHEIERRCLPEQISA